MATQYKKFVLPTPAEFVRYLVNSVINGVKKEVDVDTPVTPIVSRAKALVARKGVIEVTEERPN